jgi:hypothetical protein
MCMIQVAYSCYLIDVDSDVYSGQRSLLDFHRRATTVLVGHRGSLWPIGSSETLKLPRN